MSQIIKIICPVCGSDKIDDISGSGDISTFVCDECEYEFTVNMSEDMWTIENR